VDDAKAQIRLYLELQSASLTPEDISRELGVAFDRAHRKGEPRAKTHLNEAWWQKNPRFWDVHWWTLYEEADSSYADAYADLPIALKRLLDRIEPSWEKFARLASVGSGELAIVIQADGYPGMNIPSDLLKQIARLNVPIDFDLYTDPECKRLHAD
jgi:hypothetical protein